MTSLTGQFRMAVSGPAELMMGYCLVRAGIVSIMPRCITLRGNHEQMMIGALRFGNEASRAIWLERGGEETMQSYHRRGLERLTDDHLNWLPALAIIYRDEQQGLVFIHGGIDPDAFPECGERMRMRMWTRRPEVFDTRCWTAPSLIGQMRGAQSYVNAGLEARCHSCWSQDQS